MFVQFRKDDFGIFPPATGSDPGPDLFPGLGIQRGGIDLEDDLADRADIARSGMEQHGLGIGAGQDVGVKGMDLVKDLPTEQGRIAQAVFTRLGQDQIILQGTDPVAQHLRFTDRAFIQGETLFDGDAFRIDVKDPGLLFDLGLETVRKRFATIHQVDLALAFVDFLPDQEGAPDDRDILGVLVHILAKCLIFYELVPKIDAGQYGDHNNDPNQLVDVFFLIGIDDVPDGKAQESGDHQCREGDEDRIDGEEVKSAEKEIELAGAQAVSSRAERGHQGCGNGHTRDDIPLHLAAGRHDPGQAAEERDHHVINGGTGAGQEFAVGSGYRTDGKVERRGDQSGDHRKAVILDGRAEQWKIVGSDAVSQSIDGSHEGGDQHRADHHGRGIHVEPDGRHDNGKGQDPEIGTLEDDPLFDLLVDGVVIFNLIAQVDKAEEVAEHDRWFSDERSQLWTGWPRSGHWESCRGDEKLQGMPTGIYLLSLPSDTCPGWPSVFLLVRAGWVTP